MAARSRDNVSEGVVALGGEEDVVGVVFREGCREGGRRGTDSGGSGLFGGCCDCMRLDRTDRDGVDRWRLLMLAHRIGGALSGFSM